MPPNQPLNLVSNTQKTGARFERVACEYLQTKGLTLVAQNWQQPRVGEIDLIMTCRAHHINTLVFIEVRARKSSGFGGAADSISTAKQRKVIKAARYFLQKNPQFADYDCRFDVVAFDGLGDLSVIKACHIEWIIGAFMAGP